MRQLILWVPDDEHYSENIARLQANPPAPFRKKESCLPKWLRLCLLAVLSPLFIVSAALTIPLWGMWLIIQHHVEDTAFHNSVQYVWQLLFMPLTLFTLMPFWMFVQEYMYQLRNLKCQMSNLKSQISNA
jgi:hypothetical protein